MGVDHLAETVDIVGVAHLEARLESVETVVGDDHQIVEVGLALVLDLVLEPVLALEADPSEVDPFVVDPSVADPSVVDPSGAAPV